MSKDGVADFIAQITSPGFPGSGDGGTKNASPAGAGKRPLNIGLVSIAVLVGVTDLSGITLADTAEGTNPMITIVTNVNRNTFRTMTAPLVGKLQQLRGSVETKMQTLSQQ
jgi:hypothetical protein